MAFSTLEETYVYGDTYMWCQMAITSIWLIEESSYQLWFRLEMDFFLNIHNNLTVRLCKIWIAPDVSGILPQITEFSKKKKPQRTSTWAIAICKCIIHSKHSPHAPHMVSGLVLLLFRPFRRSDLGRTTTYYIGMPVTHVAAVKCNA